jgi:hypothetical protein
VSKNPFLVCLHVQAASHETCTISEAGRQRLAQRWCKGSIPAVLEQEERFKSDERAQQEKSLKSTANEKDVPTNKTFLLIN